MCHPTKNRVCIDRCFPIDYHHLFCGVFYFCLLECYGPQCCLVVVGILYTLATLPNHSWHSAGKSPVFWHLSTLWDDDTY